MTNSLNTFEFHRRWPRAVSLQQLFLWSCSSCFAICFSSTAILILKSRRISLFHTLPISLTTLHGNCWIISILIYIMSTVMFILRSRLREVLFLLFSFTCSLHLSLLSNVIMKYFAVLTYFILFTFTITGFAYTFLFVKLIWVDLFSFNLMAPIYKLQKIFFEDYFLSQV